MITSITYLGEVQIFSRHVGIVAKFASNIERI